jgi:biopolymer transport protein ExbD
MSRFIQEDEEIIAGINVTPLVDITLVLLIIFMVTATIMVNPAIRVNLPRAAGVDDAPDTTLSLVMDVRGQLFINGKAVTRDQAAGRLVDAVRSDPQVQVLIAADRGVVYQRVIDLITLVNQAGVKNFALNVDRE